MADKYLIRVTAGPGYDPDLHVEVPVNSLTPVHIASDLIDTDLCVRVRNYRGLPRSAPHDSPYFESEPHKTNGDQYSIGFRFRLKDPNLDASSASASPAKGVKDVGERGEEGEGKKQGEEGNDQGDGEEEEEDEEEKSATPAGVPGTDLQFGNDFDHAIRDRLPPGFGTAMNIVKWWIDPGLEGDPYADVPYLYGPALSSFNAVHVGEGEEDEEKGGLWFDEGGDEQGMEWRREVGAPEDAKARMKWALKAGSKESWTWEYGRSYGVDFFNPYVDFHEFALRLPGFNLPIMKYWDGQGLRYVLRNRSTGQVYLVVLFTLHLAEDVNEDGTLKPSALEAMSQVPGAKGTEPELELEPDEEDFNEEEALGEARRKLSGVDLNGVVETKEDDVD